MKKTVCCCRRQPARSGTWRSSPGPLPATVLAQLNLRDYLLSKGAERSLLRQCRVDLRQGERRRKRFSPSTKAEVGVAVCA